MKIFRTTFHLNEDVHEEALAYIKNVYIKNAQKGGVLYEPQLSKILVDYQEAGSSYVLQFRVKDRVTLNQWTEEIGGELQEDFYMKFGEKVCSFSVLEKKLDLDQI